MEKSGAIEIIDDGAGDMLQIVFPSYEGGLRSQPTESEESAIDWRNGFFGGILSGSTPEVINATKNITKEIVKKSKHRNKSSVLGLIKCKGIFYNFF